MKHTILCSLAILSIAAFFYDVQAAPTALALRSDPSGVIDTTGDSNTRVKRQGGGCGCCGCGCCGCGGCGCCCCRPKCCCCCQRCCTCCRTCCCTRCCTCCRPCCCGCGCGCGCCGCGGGRKRRSLQKLAVKLAEKKSLEAASSSSEVVAPVASHEEEVKATTSAQPEEKEVEKREAVQTPVGAIVDVPEWPNSYGYY